MKAKTLDSRVPLPARAGAERVRLLKFITNFYIGGTERQFMVLGRGLDRTRFDVRAACLRKEGPFLAEMQAEGIPVQEHRIRSLYRPSTLGMQIRLAAALWKERVQIVHTYGFYPNTFALAPARAAGVPVIVASIRDIGDIWTPLQRRLQRLVCRLADAIAVNAEAVKRRLIDEGYDGGRVVVIENGIDVARFSGANAAGRLRHELGLPAGIPLVAVLSRLNKDKGISHFLKAAASLRSAWPDARWLLLGDGPDRALLEQEAKGLGLADRAHFLGFRTDVADILPEITVSVLPSLSEALSNVVLESMAAERPVVVTRVGGLPEVVDDGVHGLLVPPGDERALARGIDTMLRDPGRAADMGRSARQRVTREFSLQRMIDRTQQMYESLLERHVRGQA
ncbi:MAG: glycosyltransferase [Candidatus Polarisedimenticolia bacterium]